MILAIIVILGLCMFQMDFRSAFLESPITHDVYIEQPDGFIEPGKEHLVCKLKKSIYGTKQGSHDWQETLAKGYTEDGYITSKADLCIRYKHVDGKYTITSTYGDGVCGGLTTKEGKMKAVSDLGKRWESSEVESKVLLGMVISQDPVTGAITILQRAYLERMLEQFAFQNVRIRCTPLPPSLQLSDSPVPLPEEERVFMKGKPYGASVGSVLWTQGCSCPDFSLAAGLLARFQQNPGKIHWEAVEWLAGYIKGLL